MAKRQHSSAKPGGEAVIPRGRPREFDMDKALDAAMEVFWRKGYMQTTLGDLCAAMSIKPPSFYCAFGSRENIFLLALRHYLAIFWQRALSRFMEQKDLSKAFGDFFEDAIQIYMRPNLPHGCFIDISTIGLSPNEIRIKSELDALSREINEIVRKRLLLAIEEQQIPESSDVPAIVGAARAFLKGLSILSRGDVCQAELQNIAKRGLLLIPVSKSS